MRLQYNVSLLLFLRNYAKESTFDIRGRGPSTTYISRLPEGVSSDNRTSRPALRWAKGRKTLALWHCGTGHSHRDPLHMTFLFANCE